MHGVKMQPKKVQSMEVLDFQTSMHLFCALYQLHLNNANLKDSAYTIVIAHTFCASGDSHFLWVVLTTTGKFLHELILC